MAGDDPGEDLLGSLGLAGLEVDVAEDVEELDVVRRGRQLPLQHVDGPLGPAAALVDLDQADDAPGIARPEGQGLVQDGHGVVDPAFFAEDQGQLVELFQGRYIVADAAEQAGQGLPRVGVLPVELDDLLEDSHRLGGLLGLGSRAATAA